MVTFDRTFTSLASRPLRQTNNFVVLTLLITPTLFGQCGASIVATYIDTVERLDGNTIYSYDTV